MSSVGSDQEGGDVELNLAPIIDCFTVLITYLLLSASFISLGMLDVSVPSDVGVMDTPTPDVAVTIILSKNGEIKLKEEGTRNHSETIPANTEGTWDYDTLATQLKTIHEQFPSLEGGLLTADDTVNYRNIVKAVETIKTFLPQVSLSPENK